MFTDEWCEDWATAKNQDDFIKEYFNEKGVDSAVKISHAKAGQQKIGCSSSSYHHLQNKHSLNYQLEYNKKRKKKKIQLCDSSQECSSEIGSQIVDMIESPKHKLDNVKKKKKLFLPKSFSNESSKLLKVAEDINTKAEIIIDNFSSSSVKKIDSCNNEMDFDSLKLKKKKKDSIPEDNIFVHNDSEESSDVAFNDSSVRCNNSIEKNLDCNIQKIKKKKLKRKSKNIGKFSESDVFSNEAETISDAACNDSHTKSNLFENSANCKNLKMKTKKFKNTGTSFNSKIFSDEAETGSDAAFNDSSTKNDNLSENGVDCNTLKKKKKKIRNKFKNIEKSSESVIFSDETESIGDTTFSSCVAKENNLIRNNSDSNFPKKKRKKTEKSLDCNEFFNEVEPINFDVSQELSLKKNKLHQSKAYQKLQAAKFRYLNEMLYTNSGKDALSYFQENTDEYLDYHLGYQSQVSKWPINPVDVIIQEISKINKQAVIADLGCGEAKIAEVFPNRTVHSFDLIALKDCVTACDMANVPLPTNSVDVVVFCLSLMGTNWKDYLKESQRILKFGGIMKIAEIESRIENLQHFIKEIENFGFSLINQNLSHKMFVFLNFKRANRNKKSSKVPAVTLKPCLYKKR